MQQLSNPIVALSRPRVLVRAARAGLSGYRRERHLPRFLRNSTQSGKGHQVFAALCEAEAACEQARLSREAGYSFMRHVGLLIALLAEMRALNLEPQIGLRLTR